MLLYSTLYLAGYDITLDQIKRFRQLDSPAAGHPEYGHVPGVETTTGPLGQGISTAVGMALGERMLAARFNRGGHTPIDTTRTSSPPTATWRRASPPRRPRSPATSGSAG